MLTGQIIRLRGRDAPYRGFFRVRRDEGAVLELRRLVRVGERWLLGEHVTVRTSEVRVSRPRRKTLERLGLL